MGTTALIVIMSARYLTSDPTQSLALTRDGRPYMDFAAAPSLFLEEDIRQENLLLVHRQKVCEDLNSRRSTRPRPSLPALRPSASLKPRSRRSVLPLPVLPRLVRLRSVPSSNAQPSRLHTPMQRCRPALLSPVPKSFVRCCRVPVPSRSVLPRSASRQPRPPRRQLLLLVVLRQLLLRPVGHKTVPTASASPWRPRPTELHQSIPPCLAVVATLWIKYMLILWGVSLA